MTDAKSAPGAQHPGEEPLVIFTPSGKRGRFPIGTPVLQAARALGVDLDSVCGGRGICSKCQVTPAYGSFPKHGVTVAENALSPWNQVEARYDAKRGLTRAGFHVFEEASNDKTISIVLADSQNNVWGDEGPLPGSETRYVAKAWCFGTLTLDPVLDDQEAFAGLAERLGGVVAADAEDIETLFADPAGQAGEIAVRGDQHEAVEPPGMQQVHRVDHQGDIAGVLADGIGGLVVRHEPEFGVKVGPAFHVAA